jgi:hypothetical protein
VFVSARAATFVNAVGKTEALPVLLTKIWYVVALTVEPTPKSATVGEAGRRV